MSDHEFQNRTALVTGGSRGIGRACCERLARAGANVAVNYRNNEDAAAETVRMVETAGAKAMPIRADVSSPDDVRAMVRTVTDAFGPVELLVNNAGLIHRVTHEETTLDVWNETLQTNLTGAYLVTWEVKEGMIERGFGRIVNVASIAGLRPRPRAIAYSVSKAALISLTQNLGAALAEHDIRVNAVAPGLIETDILADAGRELLDELVQATPIRRMGHPAEIADMVAFLLGEEASFITGQTYVVDGGRVMLP